MVFIDLEKAYDKVPREVLWWARTRKGIWKKYIDIIMDMDEGASTNVRSREDREFPITTAIHQVSAHSPFVFSMDVEKLISSIQGGIPWSMLSADNIVLVEKRRKA